MMQDKEISIIGATGNLGAPVAKNLLEFGYKLNLIVRNRAKAIEIFGKNPNIKITEADLRDKKALRDALSETEYLYLNLSTTSVKTNIKFAPEREGVANILAAVNRETIKQIIAISGLGAFDNVDRPNGFTFIPNIIRKQGHILIKESGIPYTLLHCTWFLDSFVIYRRNNVYSVIGDTKNQIFFTDCYNYSLHLSNAIGNSKAFFKEFPVQGIEGYRHNDAAEKFLAIYSPKTKVTILPYGLIRTLAFFNNNMKFVKHMCDYSYASKEEFLAEEFGTYKVLGSPKLNLTEYANKVLSENVYTQSESKDN